MNALIAAMAAHVALTSVLYVLLTIARAPKIWGIGQRSDGSNPWADIEPRISANLSNQFEWPLLFYVACILLLQMQWLTDWTVAMAWLFVLGRFLHSGIQIFTPNIRLRGLVFTINFVAVMAIWGMLLVRVYN